MPLSDDWEQEAGSWIKWARAPGHDSYWRFHRDQFLTIVPAPGKLTLDLGCGEGRFARDLKRLGHRVIGVDSASTLLEAARRADPGGDYRSASATKLPLENASCDLVIAFMMLQDLDELTAVVNEMGRVLVARGTACIAIVHPLNSAGRFANESADSAFVIPRSYLDEFGYVDDFVRDGLRMVFHSRHRPLEAYSRALEAAGFVIDAIREHRIPEEGLRSDRSRRWRRIPLFLHLRARKQA
jgi:SAM-dependent methyltransferase